MIQINPKEKFVISRGLPDSSDAGTYYVRAFVRDAKTDTLLSTINLVDKGNQRFQEEYEAPNDPTGNGVQIIISTIVYTDSGYTTASPDYGIEYAEYLVQQRYNLSNPQYGFGGSDINYKKIEKIVLDIVSKEISKIVIPEQKEVDFNDVKQQISESISGVIDYIDNSVSNNKYDDSSIKTHLSKLEKEVSRIDDELFSEIKLLGDKIERIDVNPVVSIEKDEFPKKTFDFLKKLFTRKKKEEVVIERRKIKDEFGLRGELKSNKFVNEFNL